MSVRSFLYRRLARLITAEFRLPQGGAVSLQSRFDVASFQDVFCSPFYWRMFEVLKERPSLVVDLGAHCGHATILADQCIRTKFGRSADEYLLVEANPSLIGIIRRNIDFAGLGEKARIHHGLVGQRSGTGTLHIHPKNFLTSSVTGQFGGTPQPIPYVDLEALVGGRRIDLLKMDIEGSEYTVAEVYPELLGRVGVMFLELHEAEPGRQAEFLATLRDGGLKPVSEAIPSCGQQLLILSR